VGRPPLSRGGVSSERGWWCQTGQIVGVVAKNATLLVSSEGGGPNSGVVGRNRGEGGGGGVIHPLSNATRRVQTLVAWPVIW